MVTFCIVLAVLGLLIFCLVLSSCAMAMPTFCLVLSSCAMVTPMICLVLNSCAMATPTFCLALSICANFALPHLSLVLITNGSLY